MDGNLHKESQYNVKKAIIKHVHSMTEHEKFFELILADCTELGHEPGQFIMLSVPGVGEAPISLSSSPTRKESFELVVRKSGTLTGALHRLTEGDAVGIRGPYGKGFPVKQIIGNDLVIVAGGLGIGPLRSLIQYVIDKRREFGRMYILLGCKTPKDMLFGEEVVTWVNNMDVGFNCTVDRGDPEWKGNVGLITQLIPGQHIDPERSYAVIVGPPIMYKYVIAELKSKGIRDERILLSLERRMRCGVGKCGHCQIEDLYCCQNGPVFNYLEVKDKFGALGYE